MEIGRAIKRRMRAVAAPLFFLAVIGYFGYNVTSGKHGLMAQTAREKLLAQAQHDLAQAKAARAEWENRVSGLQADHIDADMLDEQARAMLNLSNPNDIIFMYPNSGKPRAQ